MFVGVNDDAKIHTVHGGVSIIDFHGALQILDVSAK